MTYLEWPEAFFYVLAGIGVFGLTAIVGVLAKADDPEKYQRLLGICVLWQLLPVTAWLYSYWESETIYGPSSFFRAAEFTSVVLVPIVSGLVHRSWRVAALSLALPIVAFGLMMAVFILIMGSGR